MTFSKEEKTLWLEDWKQSGKKAWTYAKENGLIPQTFCSWVKQDKKKTTGFVEITRHKNPEQYQLQQEILIEKGEIKIHIPLAAWTEVSESILGKLRLAI